MSLEATCLCGLSHMHMQQGSSASASLLFTLVGTGAQAQIFIMKSNFLLLFFLLLVSHGSSAVITGVSGNKQVETLQCNGKLSAQWKHAEQVMAFQTAIYKFIRENIS